MAAWLPLIIGVIRTDSTNTRDDSVSNDGLIRGAEALGGGDDTYSNGETGITIGTVNGGAGVDFLSGGNATDRFLGGAGNDILLGGDGNDLLSGGTEADGLDGGDGNDILEGGQQVDNLT